MKDVQELRASVPPPGVVALSRRPSTPQRPVETRPIDRATSCCVDQDGQLRGAQFEFGTDDVFPHIPTDAQAFSEALTAAGVEHTLEIHDGGHGDRVPERLETTILPFFSALLSPDSEGTAVQAVSWGQVKTGLQP